MNITYGFLKPLGCERINLASAGSYTAADSCGTSAVLKAVTGDAYICGGDSPIGTDCYILSEGERIHFSGTLKVMAKDASFEARVLYFDSI